MLLYILKRLLASVGTLLVVLAITFFLMNAVPGSPFITEKSTPEQIAACEKSLTGKFLKEKLTQEAHG